jgi:hypothetical protein
MFGLCSDFSEGKDTLSFNLSLAVYRHGYDGTGEGGIRTLGSLLSYGALAKRCFQPLSHLTKICSHQTLRMGDYRRESRISRRIADCQLSIGN